MPFYLLRPGSENQQATWSACIQRTMKAEDFAPAGRGTGRDDGERSYVYRVATG